MMKEEYFKKLTEHKYIMDNVISYLNINDIIKLESVNKNLMKIALDKNHRWKSACYDAFLNVKETSICNGSKDFVFVTEMNEEVLKQKKYNFKKFFEKGIKIMLEWEGKYNYSQLKFENFTLIDYQINKKKGNISFMSLNDNLLTMTDYNTEYKDVQYNSTDDLELLPSSKVKISSDTISIPKKLSDHIIHNNDIIINSDFNLEILKIRNIVFKIFRGKSIYNKRIYG